MSHLVMDPIELSPGAPDTGDLDGRTIRLADIESVPILDRANVIVTWPDGHRSRPWRAAAVRVVED